jgi:hypothetical protein
VGGGGFHGGAPVGGFHGPAGGGGVHGPAGGGAVRGPAGGTAVRGPAGGTAVRGPAGGTVARGPAGGTFARTPHGGTFARTPHGGTFARTPQGSTFARGPHGGFARAPWGRAAVVHNTFFFHGNHFVRPAWGWNHFNHFSAGFWGFPGWTSYGWYWGLCPPLAVYGSLAFLSAGLLIGTYYQGDNYDNTVYVYVVHENGVDKEYQVDSYGNILSVRVLGPSDTGGYDNNYGDTY